MGNPFRIALTGQKEDFDNSDLEVFAYRYSKITETKVRAIICDFHILMTFF